MIEMKYLGEKNAAFIPVNRVREQGSDSLSIDGLRDHSHVVQEVRANLELLDDLHGRMNFMMNEIYRIVKR